MSVELFNFPLAFGREEYSKPVLICRTYTVARTVARTENTSYHQTKQNQIKPLLCQNLGGGVVKKNIDGGNADDLLKA